MPRNANQSYVEIAVDAADGAEQYIPIIGSSEYTRFTIHIDFVDAGDATLVAALKGSLTDDGADIPATEDTSDYLMIKNAMDNGVMDAVASGIHSVKLETFMGGGVMLHLQNLNDAATIKVQMLGNVFGHAMTRTY